jgi:energy-converting hydrogenase Eha subunit A
MVDLKGLGYLISSVSVGFLGAVALPGPDDPKWHAWAVAIGMATSIIGMGVRFISHRKDRKDIHRAARDQQPSPD